MAGIRWKKFSIPWRKRFARRTNPFDHTDHHQESDRRERQHLRQPDAGQAVDPAAFRDIEQRRDDLGDPAGHPEQQDDGKPNYERWRDDWQYGQPTQQLGGADSAAGYRKRKREAQQGRADAHQARQEQPVRRTAERS